MSKKKPVDDLSRSVQALDKKKPYICSLRFPNYKNLKIDSELPFSFPITILLGRNGTNKSSILHALYGSPSGQTIADFWFETELDAIPIERNGRKQSVIHTYRDEKDNIVECIKARAPRTGHGDKDPDYWEAVKHSQIYGLSTSGTRISPIKLKVIHLDFRGELPAFDKYFYFPDPKHLTARARKAKESGILRREYRKQDYLRSRSGQLKKKIEATGIELTNDELEVLRYILERDYLSGKVLKHSVFHGHEGYTILFETPTVNGYSDAFAGSGESAATLLVHNIFKAPEGSLLLLDEPETSLHPRAQQRLLEFIAHQAVRKSLQIVIATHSIHLAKGLPQTALRVLILEKNGVEIRTNLSADEALHEIDSIPAGKTILVEDERAKHIVLSALKLSSSQSVSEFNIIVREGGVSRIYSDIQAYANSETKDVFIIFDGDNEPKISIPDEGTLPQGIQKLDELIKELTKGNDKKGPKLDFVDKDFLERKRYIGFLRKFVKFLPELNPEHFVWDESAVKEIIGKEIPQEILQEKDFKIRFHLIANESLGLDAEAVFKFLLSKLLNGNCDRKKSLIDMIQKIRSTT